MVPLQDLTHRLQDHRRVLLACLNPHTHQCVTIQPAKVGRHQIRPCQAGKDLNQEQIPHPLQIQIVYLELLQPLHLLHRQDIPHPGLTLRNLQFGVWIMLHDTHTYSLVDI